MKGLQSKCGNDEIYQTDEKTLHCYNGSHRHFSRYSNKEWCGLGKKLKECSFRDGKKSKRCFPKEGSKSLELRDWLNRGGSIKTKTKRKTKTKTKKRKTRKNVNIPKIFVINLKKDKDKWNKYKNDDRYIRFSACNGIEMSKDNPYYDRLQIMWNVKEKKRKCTAGILNSHMTIIKKIVKNKIDQALIIEDDAIIDFKLLKKINLDKLPQDSIIYFGGSLHPPDTFKNKGWSHEKIIKSFKKGINKIDPEKFRILGGHGYYFPKWEHAKQLVDIINKKKKIRALDTEMVKLQRSGIIKYFYYPAISYLNTEDAKKGVHAIHMNRDMKFYGG